MTLAELCGRLERIAPTALAADWDNVGLLVGDASAQVRRAVLTIDLTDAVLDEAIAVSSDVAICYHPPIFKPLASLRADRAGPGGRVAGHPPRCRPVCGAHGFGRGGRWRQRRPGGRAGAGRDSADRAGRLRRRLQAGDLRAARGGRCGGRRPVRRRRRAYRRLPQVQLPPRRHGHVSGVSRRAPGRGSGRSRAGRRDSPGGGGAAVGGGRGGGGTAAGPPVPRRSPSICIRWPGWTSGSAWAASADWPRILARTARPHQEGPGRRGASGRRTFAEPSDRGRRLRSGKLRGYVSRGDRTGARLLPDRRAAASRRARPPLEPACTSSWPATRPASGPCCGRWPTGCGRPAPSWTWR